MLEHMVRCDYGASVGVGHGETGFYLVVKPADGSWDDRYLEGLTEADLRVLQRALMVALAETRAEARRGAE